MLFQSKFGILPRNQGSRIHDFIIEENGYILLIDILTKCIAAPIIGIISDKYGRKSILQFGIVMIGASMVGMGYSTNIYP